MNHCIFSILILVVESLTVFLVTVCMNYDVPPFEERAGGRKRERDATEIDLEFQGNNSFYNSFLRHLVIFFPRREKGIDCIILLRDE